MTEKTVSDIFNKNDYKDAGVMKTIVGIRTYNKRLGFSQNGSPISYSRLSCLRKKNQGQNPTTQKRNNCLKEDKNINQAVITA